MGQDMKNKPNYSESAGRTAVLDLAKKIDANPKMKAALLAAIRGQQGKPKAS
jgi:hypothetical protein